MYDYVIVGMGISGIYMAWRLNRMYPYRRILCLEKQNRYGGRIVSVPFAGTTVDLGAFRYLPTKQKTLANLITKFGIETIPIDATVKKTYIRNGSDTYYTVQSPDFVDNLIVNAPKSDIGFIEYLYSKGCNDEDIYRFADRAGYNIFKNDVTLDLMQQESENSGQFYRIKNGFITLCKALLSDMNSNVCILLNTKVQSVNGNYIYFNGGCVTSVLPPIVTVQPNDVFQYKSEYMDVMLPYNAIRIYLKVDIDVPQGYYITTLPIRKLFSLGNNILLIYSDSYDATVLSSFTDLSVLEEFILLTTGYKVKIKNIIAKYWEPGIFFWKPKINKPQVPFIYCNGDVSNEQGWINGALNFVDENIARYRL